jgi:hypothetical protein
MDEACSNVRVQLDSKPEDIDGMERQKVRLQVGGHRGGPGAAALLLSVCCNCALLPEASHHQRPHITAWSLNADM